MSKTFRRVVGNFTGHRPSKKTNFYTCWICKGLTFYPEDHLRWHEGDSGTGIRRPGNAHDLTVEIFVEEK